VWPQVDGTASDVDLQARSLCSSDDFWPRHANVRSTIQVGPGYLRSSNGAIEFATLQLLKRLALVAPKPYFQWHHRTLAEGKGYCYLGRARLPASRTRMGWRRSARRPGARSGVSPGTWTPSTACFLAYRDGSDSRSGANMPAAKILRPTLSMARRPAHVLHVGVSATA